MDLRERVVAAVETGGMSCHQAAAQFGVGVSTAIVWVRRLRETGSVAPGQIGGHKPKAISGEHRAWLLERTKARDFTLRGLVAELAQGRRALSRNDLHRNRRNPRSIYTRRMCQLFPKLRIWGNLVASCSSRNEGMDGEKDEQDQRNFIL
jgi:transposase-like protein